MKVAVIDGKIVIKLGEYTQEQYPDKLLVEITQEEYDVIITYTEPRYNGVKFYDNYYVYVMADTERSMAITRIENGKLIYAEVFGRLRTLFKMELITQQEHITMLSAFIPVKNQLFNGDLLEAKQAYESIDVEIFGEELYNEFLSRINYFAQDAYLLYPWEYAQKSIISSKVSNLKK
jgi:hypothetical protein